MMMMGPINTLPNMKMVPNTAPPTLTPEQDNQCKKTEATAREFVSLFYYKVVEAMRKPVMPDPVTGVGGKSEELYDTLLNEYYAVGIAKQDRSNLVGAIAYTMSRGTVCEAVFNPYARYTANNGMHKRMPVTSAPTQETLPAKSTASLKQVPYEQRTMFLKDELDSPQLMGGDHESKNRYRTPPG
jgi:Rod binding domain-containing protein